MKLYMTKGQRLLKLLVVFLLAFSSVKSIKAQGSADISFNPSTSNVSVNDVFTVDVAVDILANSITNLDVFVNFDPTYLEVLSVTVPPSTVTALPAVSINFAPIATMNATGEIDHGRGTLTPPFPSADFVFFTIEFRAIAIPGGGSTPLEFNLTGIRETLILDGASLALNAAINGAVNITAACTPPTATITNTPTCNGQDFDLILDAATGVAPFDLIIDGITYNNINVGGTITTISAPELSLWTPADQPADLNLNDGSDVTVGTKFFSSVDGFVKGVRFFKGAASTGIFRGKLYNFATQTLLANATFVTSASGWQEVLFSTPVQITASTVYLAAVYSEDGYYAATDQYHNAFTYTNGPLTSPSGDGSTGINSNGLYIYDEAFPTSSFQNSGYFIDVVFSPSEFAIELTSVTGDDGCVATGTPLQTLNVTSTPCATLPVSLLSLSASTEGSNRIVVKWATANEQNNKGFEVMRSLDGSSNWQSVGFVNGAGDSYSRKDYSFTDDNLIARRYFYQLKQIDFDGKYKYTAVVSANLSGKEGFSLEQNFPNPFKGNETTIRFSLPRRTQVQLIVYDMNGRVVKTLVNGVKDSGTHIVPFRETGLPSGVYFYRLQADGFTDVKKMTVK